LVATKNRFKEVNHLLLSGQKVPERRSQGAAEPVSFLKGLGIAGDDFTVDPKLIFVLTPFAREEEATFESIQKVCRRTGFKCVRGDEEFAKGDILTHILRQIVRRSVNRRY
jgi:hypothetical protein